MLIVATVLFISSSLLAVVVAWHTWPPAVANACHGVRTADDRAPGAADWPRHATMHELIIQQVVRGQCLGVPPVAKRIVTNAA